MGGSKIPEGSQSQPGNHGCWTGGMLDMNFRETRLAELRLIRLLTSSAADPPTPQGLRLRALPLVCHSVVGRLKLIEASYLGNCARSRPMLRSRQTVGCEKRERVRLSSIALSPP